MKKATDAQKQVLHECPMCSGAGQILMDLRIPAESIGKAASELQANGASLREIADKLGLNRTIASHVRYYIDQYNKKYE